MTPLNKKIVRLVQVSNGGGWQSAWVVGLEPGRLPYLSFRLPRRRTVYTIALSECLDLAEKKAAIELTKARKLSRVARKAAGK